MRIVGDLDALSVSEAAPALIHFKLSPPAHLHIDATEASFLDSTGLAAIGMAADAVRRNGGKRDGHRLRAGRSADRAVRPEPTDRLRAHLTVATVVAVDRAGPVRSDKVDGV